jgi:UDP-N-acetylmuramyl pentapeptide phosphotransferase/UDP-N-acetylglucosamine-1-phosphate transferase
MHLGVSHLVYLIGGLPRDGSLLLVVPFLLAYLLFTKLSDSTKVDLASLVSFCTSGISLLGVRREVRVLCGQLLSTYLVAFFLWTWCYSLLLLFFLVL